MKITNKKTFKFTLLIGLFINVGVFNNVYAATAKPIENLVIVSPESNIALPSASIPAVDDNSLQEIQSLISNGSYDEAIKLIGDPIAKKDYELTAILGELYLEGKGVNKNIKKAFELLTIAAKNNNFKGELLLGKMYLNGTYIQPDINKAIILFKQASSHDRLGEASYELGIMYLYNPWYRTSNAYEGVRLLDFAVSKGKLIGAQYLARYYLDSYNRGGIIGENKSKTKLNAYMWLKISSKLYKNLSIDKELESLGAFTPTEVNAGEELINKWVQKNPGLF